MTTDPSCLLKRQDATFASNHRILGIVRPCTVAQVQTCMRIAQQHRVPLYPVSSGRNWGYGSSVPSADGCLLLDLSGMKRIHVLNERLAYVTIEPGVTQRQLFEHLRQQGSRLWMDATGSSPDCSIIGNAVERGFGHTPYGDHFANACALQVVLPDGELVETGFAQFPNAATAPAYRWGVGPSTDGLFAQSNFGVVTRMTVWLMPAPEYFQAFFFKTRRDENLESILDALRILRLEGSLRSAVHVANDYKVACSIGQYPWKAAHGRTPLPPQLLHELSQRWDFGAWNGSGALYGTKAQVAASRKRLQQLLGPHVDRLRFVDDRLIAIADRIHKPYRWLTGVDLAAVMTLVRPVYELMKGIPTDAMLASAYWRKTFPAPADPHPDRDRCGLIWCAPVAPAEPGAVREMVNIVRSVFARHPFEPAMSMTLRTERCVDNVIAISYDREVAGEDERAMQCHDELLQALLAADLYPYRLGIQAFSAVEARKAPGARAFISKLKAAVDPHQILAPGRYV